MQYFLHLIGILFLIINLKIVYNDIKYKKIPNKLLVILIGLGIIYNIAIVISGGGINIGSIFLGLIISFILFYFGIWGAGDAKYLFVLNLFLTQISIISFICNIALVIIIYSIINYIRFFIGKPIIKKGYLKNLILHFKGEYQRKKEKESKKIIKKIYKQIIMFLVIFSAIRLLRISIIEEYSYFIEYIITDSKAILLVIVLLGSIILMLYIIGKKLNESKIGNRIERLLRYSLILLSIATISYYMISSIDDTLNSMGKILTIYLAIYLLLLVLRKGYVIAFVSGEKYSKDIELIKAGDILDTEDLEKQLGENSNGSYVIYKNKNRVTKIKNKIIRKLFFGDHKKYIKGLKGPLSIQDAKDIKSLIENTNKVFKILRLYKDGGEPIKTVNVIKSFALAPYIFIAFIISYFGEENYLMEGLKIILVYIYGL